MTELHRANQATSPEIHEAAARMAYQCRRLIQACLREEEWGDADYAFYMVIRDGLETFALGERSTPVNHLP